MNYIPQFFDVSSLAEDLRAGKSLIVPNQRLVSRIQFAYGQYFQQKGLNYIAEPNIKSLKQLQESCWHYLLIQAKEELLHTKRISVEQELLIWVQIVESSEKGQTLMQQRQTAKLMMSAYQLIKQWDLSLNDEEIKTFFEFEESLPVYQWFIEFEAYCKEHQIICEAQLAGRIICNIDQSDIENLRALLGELLLTGFINLPPVYQALIEKLGEVNHIVPSSRVEKKQVIKCDDVIQQYYAAAIWAKNSLDENPQQRIAVVIPDLAAQRGTIQRIFSEVFEPEKLYNSEGRINYPFNISAGYSLADSPLVQSVIDIWQLSFREITIEQLQNLINSPFIAIANTEKPLLMALNEHCLSLKKKTISLSECSQTLTYYAEKIGVDSTLSKQFIELNELFRRATKQGASHFDEILELMLASLAIFSWPGNRVADSIEFQEFKQLVNCIEKFSTLKKDLSAAQNGGSFSWVLAELIQLIKDTVFQPESPDSSLQILGLLEASGLQFDQLWLCDATDKHWPPAVKPHPLLPNAMQRQFAMPHATASRQLNYAKQLLQQFELSTCVFYASYPLIVDDNAASLSPFFSDFELDKTTDFTQSELSNSLPLNKARELSLQQYHLDTFTLSNPPPVHDEVVLGGVSILKNQSLCPFVAFAINRLALKSADDSQLGFDALDKGLMVHRALEIIWQQLKSQENLLALSEEQLSVACKNAAQLAVSETVNPYLHGKRLIALEEERIAGLLKEWLEIEAERSPFKVVATEQKMKVTLNGLNLTTRIDRIDQIAAEEFAIIDYKTGKTKISAWAGERMEDPQLPLYVSLYESQGKSVGGIGFAQVRSDLSQLNAVGDEILADNDFSWTTRKSNTLMETDWQQLKKAWHHHINKLASDFMQGEAAIDFKLENSSLESDLKYLCRNTYKEIIDD